jgi:hypothetical protein
LCVVVCCCVLLCVVVCCCVLLCVVVCCCVLLLCMLYITVAMWLKIQEIFLLNLFNIF